jgi:hypothetical protein
MILSIAITIISSYAIIVHNNFFQCHYPYTPLSLIINKVNFSDSLNNWCIWTIIWIRYINFSMNLKSEFLLIINDGGSMILQHERVCIITVPYPFEEYLNQPLSILQKPIHYAVGVTMTCKQVIIYYDV